MRAQPPDREGAAREAILLRAVGELVEELHPATLVPPVRLDSRLDSDLGLDSLALAELLVRLEQVFEIALDDGVLATAETPRDLLDELSAAPAIRAAPPSVPLPATHDAAPTAAIPADARTLVDVLDRHADEQPDQVHVRLIDGRGEVEEITYGGMREEATLVAAGLWSRRVVAGTSVAIMLPTGRDYLGAFLGVLLAGCVPVPVYPPARPSRLEEHLHRHVRLLGDAQAVALITDPAVRKLARLVAPRIATMRHLVTVDDLREDADERSRPTPHASDTALLQYTSGSTGHPKGVVLSHANLLANIRAMCQAGDIRTSDVVVSWLPLYHDMGLIGSWLLSLYAGVPFVVMSPLAFLARPSRWLRAIHDHAGTVSGGPNFGYELCLRRTSDRDLDELDLRSWRVAFNGAEPVSPTTVTRFAQRFGVAGLRPGAITPVYGLAECSVALTVPPIGRGAVIDRVAREPLARSGRAVPAADDDPTGVRFVACGRPLPGHELRVVDPSGTTLGERREGRVQFRGPSATDGYHRDPAATRQLFDGDWLETGDLGYLADGDLHVTGRAKDVIIRAGRNLHPSELEAAVGDLDGVRTGCVVAFPTTDPSVGTERLVVLAETRVVDEAERTELRRTINEAVTDVAGVPPDEVVLASPGSVPKTSSGKVRRADARDRYERGQLVTRERAVPWQLLRLASAGLPAALRRARRRAGDLAYGITAGALFVLLGALVWVLVAVVPGARRRWRIVRTACRLLFRAAGIAVTVRGAEHLPASGPYVVAANHASNLDPLVLSAVLPEPAVFAALRDIAAHPLVRHLLRRLEVHLVERGDRRGGLGATRALTEQARAGRVVAVFPEGRRSPVPGLEPFHTGAFMIAADAAVPVVPIALRGTRRILPVGQVLPRRGPVAVVVHRPELTSTPGWAGAVELRRATQAAIARSTGEPADG